MQSPTDAPRQTLTSTQVSSLLHAESVNVTAGLELVNAAGAFTQDISDRFVSGSVAHNNYADIHGTCRLRITEGLDWGSARVRLYVTLDDGTVPARFNLGVYLLETPVRVVGGNPEEFEVEGYDLLAILNVPAGESYAVAAAANVVDTVEAILTAHGAGTPFLVVQSAATMPAGKVFPLDEATSWLNIVNELLGSIGYRGLWVDWDGRYRSEPYLAPSERAPEWTYDADADNTIVGEERTVIGDYFKAPNLWVFVLNNPAVGVADPAVTGTYTVTNQSDGPTSIDARGRTIPTVRLLDAVDQASLESQGDQIVDREKRVDTTVEVTVGPNPLHWHADVIAYVDSALGAPLKAAVHKWSWAVLVIDQPPEDMQLTLRKVS